MAGLSDEHQSALHFLLRACSLLLASRSGDGVSNARINQLTSLAGRGNAAPPQIVAEAAAVAQELHGRVCHALAVAGADPSGIDVPTIGALLGRDAVNGYGVAAANSHSAPQSSVDTRGPSELRGTALYASASRINHECLPNAARYDAFDAPGAGNTTLRFRSLHALPAGEEVTQSYFPLTWTYEERQQRCKEHYGFECRCPRCCEEISWGGEQLAPSSDGQGAPQSEADPAYIHLFLLKYVCPRQGCEGTMAPLPKQPDVLQCNICGGTRTEAEFMEEVEREMSAQG